MHIAHVLHCACAPRQDLFLICAPALNCSCSYRILLISVNFCSGCALALGILLFWVYSCSGCALALGILLIWVYSCSGCGLALGILLFWMYSCSGCAPALSVLLVRVPPYWVVLLLFKCSMPWYASSLAALPLIM
jgi:hypothetical protein